MNVRTTSLAAALTIVFAFAGASLVAAPDPASPGLPAGGLASPWSGLAGFQWGDEGGGEKGGGEKGGGWGDEGGGGDEGWGEEKGGGGESKGGGEEEAPPKSEEEGYLAGKMKKISISVFFNYSIILSGDAGSATNAPAYDEAFSGGVGGGLGFGLRVMPAIDVALSLSLAAFSSSAFSRDDPTTPTVDPDEVEHEFSTYMPIAVGLGFKVYFLLDRSVGDWFSFAKNKAQTGFTPYIGYMFAIGFHPGVDWVAPDTVKYPECAYWDAGIILVQNFLFGAEFRFSASVGAMLELQLATYGAPSPSDDATANGVNEAGYMMAFQIRLGLVFAF